LETAFLKNCDLKTQKNAYSNRRQLCAFLKTQYFKRLICDFAKCLTVFLKITFFKSHILKLLFLNSTNVLIGMVEPPITLGVVQSPQNDDDDKKKKTKKNKIDGWADHPKWLV
jgi:hypothetical protein